MSTASTTLSHSEYLGTRRFSRLDGVRAVSVLLVFTAHPAFTQFWSRFHGAAGVSIFFVLSGYLITTLLAREHAAQGFVDLRAFYTRRLFRIYPTYFLMLGVYCVLILVLGLQAERRAVFVNNLPYYVLFVPEHALFGDNGGVLVPFDGAWSIGIEEKFYLLWPLIGFAVLGLAVRLRAAFVFLFVAAVEVVSVVAPGGRWVAPYALIALGTAAALLLHSPRGYALLRHAGRPPVVASIVAAILLLQVGTDQILSPNSLYIGYGVLVAVAISGLCVSTWPALDLLTTPWMAYLGRISYVFYLVHNFALNAVEMVVPKSTGSLGPSVLSTGVALLVAVLVSGAIHRWFEEPLRKMGTRIAARRGSARTPEELPAVLPQPEDRA